MEDHDPIKYIASINERQAYNILIKEYVGEENYYNAIGIKRIMDLLPEVNNEVTRDTISDFIKSKKKW